MIKFRLARKGDEKEVLTLIDIVLSEYGLNLEPSGADFDVTDITKFYFNNKGWFQVIEDDNKIIGSVGVYKINDSTCELRKMYLYKEYQGKSLGKTLLKNALQSAQNLGYTTMTLQTNSLLTKALPLYESFGFKKNNDEVCSICDISMQKDIRLT
ncbi:GNAT family N-acetyltransferase [Clostridium disporicum]|uniref:N-acetyltransferase GCN5 n=1 Tax=Clostridium disporicum TaxID=84024 RepID=A0A173Z5F4_9CLOT|nr:GNAT family N-acetyltransferase [Clostridium disporicum]CUN71642.1 N-acetyltransferase GCN5 [Clostridium disporicum]